MEDVIIFLLSMLMGVVCTIIVLCMIFFIIMVTGVHQKSKRKDIDVLRGYCRKNKNKNKKEKQDELILPRR